MVNAVIISAYKNGEGSFYEQRDRVLGALRSLKGFIGGLNILSPS